LPLLKPDADNGVALAGKSCIALTSRDHTHPDEALMETGLTDSDRRSQAYRAAAAISISLVLSVAYLLFRNWLTGVWIRSVPGWTSVWRAWVLHLGALAILAAVPFLLQKKAVFSARLRPPGLAEPDAATGADPGFGERVRAISSAYPLWMKVAAVVIAVAVSIGNHADPCLRSTYPIPDATPWSVWRYLAFLPSYLIYYIAYEFHFRGFLLPVIRERFGFTSSLLLHSIPSTLIHIGLCPAELYGSFPGQLAFGYLALRGGSFWPALLVHFLTGVTMDISVLVSSGAF